MGLWTSFSHLPGPYKTLKQGTRIFAPFQKGIAFLHSKQLLCNSVFIARVRCCFSNDEMPGLRLELTEVQRELHWSWNVSKRGRCPHKRRAVWQRAWKNKRKWVFLVGFVCSLMVLCVCVSYKAYGGVGSVHCYRQAFLWRRQPGREGVCVASGVNVAGARIGRTPCDNEAASWCSFPSQVTRGPWPLQFRFARGAKCRLTQRVRSCLSAWSVLFLEARKKYLFQVSLSNLAA